MASFRKLVFKLIQWEGIEIVEEPEEENIRVVGFTNKAILIVFGFTDPKKYHRFESLWIFNLPLSRRKRAGINAKCLSINNVDEEL